ncbi:hypothetical protein ACFL6M_02645 [Candidatus Eisenbacteria bacterium]|uniref:Uncharacterized protein n=1 Tax=Eiseniibacteriota bacterium TaxID=2212470 RepID=A0ABV6YK25_UNCEI
MKRNAFVATLLVCGLISTMTVTAIAQEGAPHPDVDMQEMMKKLEEASRPGEQHKYLDQFVGEWETTTLDRQHVNRRLYECR